MPIIAVLILHALWPAPPSFRHGFPVPFFQNARAPGSIGLCTGGSSHKPATRSGNLHHQERLKGMPLAITPRCRVFAENESPFLQRIERGSSSFVYQLAQVQFRIEHRADTAEDTVFHPPPFMSRARCAATFPHAALIVLLFLVRLGRSPASIAVDVRSGLPR